MTRPPPGARMCTACPASGWSAPAYRRTATQAPVASAAVAATGSPPHSTAWRESRTSMIHTYSVRSYSVLVQLYGRVRLVLATSPVRPVAMYGRTRGIFADSCCRITHPVPAHVSRYPRPSDTSHCHSSSAITFFYTRTRLARHLAPPLTRGARACPKTSRKPAWPRTTTPPPTAVWTA